MHKYMLGQDVATRQERPTEEPARKKATPRVAFGMPLTSTYHSFLEARISASATIVAERQLRSSADTQGNKWWAVLAKTNVPEIKMLNVASKNRVSNVKNNSPYLSASSNASSFLLDYEHSHFRLLWPN